MGPTPDSESATSKGRRLHQVERADAPELARVETALRAARAPVAFEDQWSYTVSLAERLRALLVRIEV